MTDRERLIELLYGKSIDTMIDCEYVADSLLENGVVVPPCKVGDTVYELDTIVDIDKCEDCEYYYAGGMGDYPGCNKTRYGDRTVECIEIKERIVTFSDICWWLSHNDFNKRVFLTREEAEKALAERQEGVNND